MTQKIELQAVRQYFITHYPQFIAEDEYNYFSEGNAFYTFERLADFLMESGFRLKNKDFVKTFMEYIENLFQNGDDLVRNCLNVSFVEGLIDRGYRRGYGRELREVLPYLPAKTIQYIKSFFITEVLLALDLEVEIDRVKKSFLLQLTDLYGESEAEAMLWMLIEYCANKSKKEEILQLKMEITTAQYHKIEKAVKKLLEHHPIQYILGEADFYGQKFFVNPATLIPRPETEELVFHLLKSNKKAQLQVLDIGTGTGCIPIMLALETQKANLNWAISGMDISEDALKIAEKNRKKHKVKVKWIQQDILQTTVFPQKWDIIVSNPPYIPMREQAEIAPNVLAHEPHLALFVPDEKPLLFYEAIADFALQHLTENGQLFFEIHYLYGKEILAMLQAKDFQMLDLQKDMQGNDRIVSARIGK